MKPIMLLLSASLLFAASDTLAQGQADACSPGYGSCMDRCSSRPQSLQESCAQMCEANTNRCYEGLYGGADQGGAATAKATPAPEPEARAARDQAQPADKPKKKRRH
jgi:hypothetical protein